MLLNFGKKTVVKLKKCYRLFISGPSKLRTFHDDWPANMLCGLRAGMQQDIETVVLCCRYHWHMNNVLRSSLFTVAQELHYRLHLALVLPTYACAELQAALKDLCGQSMHNTFILYSARHQHTLRKVHAFRKW